MTPPAMPTYGPAMNGDTRRVTVQDILETRECLLRFLPVELINIILDSAEHWVQVSASNTDQIQVKVNENDISESEFEAQNLELYAEKKCLTVVPITGCLHGEAPVSFKPRKVVFRLVSCDQGRSGCSELKGTYKGCYSWFDVSIGGKDKPYSPLSESHETQGRRWHLQYNAHGSRHRKRHEITWPSNEGGTWPDTGGRAGTGSTQMIDETSGNGFGIGFLDAMTGESQISVYACAKYPGWENNVFCAEVDVFYHILT